MRHCGKACERRSEDLAADYQSAPFDGPLRHCECYHSPILEDGIPRRLFQVGRSTVRRRFQGRVSDRCPDDVRTILVLKLGWCHSRHSGLDAPPTAAQASVAGVAVHNILLMAKPLASKPHRSYST